MWIPLVVIAATALQAGPVRVVRRGDERLEGITRVDIVVDQSGEARSCGVVKDGSQSTAVAALAETQVLASVSEKASSCFYSVQVGTASVVVNGRCATSVSAELVAQVDGLPTRAGIPTMTLLLNSPAPPNSRPHRPSPNSSLPRLAGRALLRCRFRVDTVRRVSVFGMAVPPGCVRSRNCQGEASTDQTQTAGGR